MTARLTPEEYQRLEPWFADIGWAAYSEGYRLPADPPKAGRTAKMRVKYPVNPPCSARYALLLGEAVLAGKATGERRPCPEKVSFRVPVSWLPVTRDEVVAGLARLSPTDLAPVPVGPTKVVTIVLPEPARYTLEALGGSRGRWLRQAVVASRTAEAA